MLHDTWSLDWDRLCRIKDDKELAKDFEPFEFFFSCYNETWVYTWVEDLCYEDGEEPYSGWIGTPPNPRSPKYYEGLEAARAIDQARREARKALSQEKLT